MKPSTAAALLVLALLGAYVYWSESRDPEVEEDRVFDVARDEIERLSILADDAAPVVLERRDGVLALVEPVAAAVDESELELVLDNLENMTFSRRLDASGDGRYGLDSERLTVRFVTSDGREDGVRFGDDTLTPSSQYAQRLGDGAVLIVAEYLSSNLGKDAWDLRDKRVFPAASASGTTAERLTIEPRDGARVEVERVDVGRWRLAAPFQAPVEPVAVEGLVSRIAGLQMLERIEAGGAGPEHALDDAAARVTLAYEGNAAPLALELGAARGIDRYARVPEGDAVFVVEGGLFDDLVRGAAYLVSRRLIPASVPEDELEATVEASSGRGAVADAERLAPLVAALRAIRAEAASEGAPDGAPTYTVRLTPGEGALDLELHVDDTTACTARRGREPVTLRLTEADCQTIVDAAESLFDR